MSAFLSAFCGGVMFASMVTGYGDGARHVLLIVSAIVYAMANAHRIARRR